MKDYIFLLFALFVIALALLVMGKHQEDKQFEQLRGCENYVKMLETELTRLQNNPNETEPQIECEGSK